MRMMLGGTWSSVPLDFHRGPGEVYVKVRAMVSLGPVEGIYFIRKKSIRLVWNYIRDIGVTTTIRKVISRSSERNRNEKYFSIGIGEVLEADVGSNHVLGGLVAFCLPVGPLCAQRVAIYEKHVEALDIGHFPFLMQDKIHFSEGTASDLPALEAEGQKGWSLFSGVDLSHSQCASLMQRVSALLNKNDWSKSRILDSENSEVQRSVGAPTHDKPASKKKRAVLFGLGNYAKTVIIPMVKDHLSIECIHEIDPTQFPGNWMGQYRFDSRPYPSEADDHDVFLIAGYHHTHAPIAVSAIRRGAIAVVEKPVTVNRAQLAELQAALKLFPGKLFSCFHKRYSPLNNLALRDLQIQEGDPVSYHCIVYEVSLPTFHWYNWPNSGSRVLSNGCHWIDHFLFMNGFRKPERINVFVAPNKTIHCSVVLENGADFSMVLTDKGSGRIGVQDHIEMRSKDVTVKITNGGSYLSENNSGIIRRHTINKLANYQAMYRAIGSNIQLGIPGDSLESVSISSGLVLDLEERLKIVSAVDAD